MKCVNEVHMIGILNGLVKYHDTRSGGKGAFFSIRITRYWKSKLDPNKWEEESKYFDLVSWAPEVVRTLLQIKPGSGQGIEVRGSLDCNKWTDKNGQERMTPRVIVSSMETIEERKEMAEHVAIG